MKKEHLFLLTSILLILISGCQGSSGFSSGPNGVQIKFIQPINTIVNIEEGDSFTLQIELTNYAECNALGKVCVRDTISDSFGGLNEKCMEINLGEARIDNKVVNLDKIPFFISVPPYTNLFADQSTDLLATAKYSCDVVMAPGSLCTKSPSDQGDPKCPSSEIISGSDLGSKVAPVTVTRIDKSISGSQNDLRLKLAITLTKMSNGKVSDLNENQDSQILNKGNPLRVNVNYAGSETNCKEKGKIIENNIIYWKFDENEKIINCDILLSSGEYNTNPVTVHLNYLYEITEEKHINIKNIET